MIGVLADGRMGNQMFQFAFGYAVSKKLDVPFFIYKADKLDYFNLIPDWKNQNKINCIEYIRTNFWKKSGIKFSFSNFTDWRIAKNMFVWENTLNEENYFLTNYSDNCFYKGYFQSQKYFSDVADGIKKCFEVKTNHQSIFRKLMHTVLPATYAAIHIRRGDYLNYGGEELGGFNLSLPDAYYKKCLSFIPSSIPKIFVTDDPEYVKNHFGDVSNSFIQHNDEITDFLILQHAQVLIMANSSFSWWAAWLNSTPGKKIYAPMYYLGFKIKKYYPAGIHVPDWEWINFTND